MRIGFIGLGHIGRHMAEHVAKAGHELVVHDVVGDAVAPFRDAGIEVVASPAALTHAADIVFTSLPGPVQVEQVVFGEDGLLSPDADEHVLVDLTTSSLAMARRVHAAYDDAGLGMLDAPVSGGPEQAARAEMTVWASGEEATFERCREAIDSFAARVRYVGPSGAGTVTKLAHNVSSYVAFHVLGEVFSVGVKAGVDPLELWSALKLGMIGRGSVLDTLPNQFLPGTYEPASFALRLAHKDMSLASAMAKEVGVAARLTNLTLEEMTEAIAKGYGDQDTRAFLKVQLERAGVEIAVDRARVDEAVSAARAALATTPGEGRR